MLYVVNEIIKLHNQGKSWAHMSHRHYLDHREVDHIIECIYQAFCLKKKFVWLLNNKYTFKLKGIFLLKIPTSEDNKSCVL
jgi:hypothetical protein